MTTCDRCNKRLTRLSSINEKVNTCHDCESAIRDEDFGQSIKGGNDSKYNGNITDDAKISTPNSTTSSNVSSISNRVSGIPGFQLPKSEINTDFKDALLASLYSQVEFLRGELEEKNLLIRTLIIKESEVYNYPESHKYSNGPSTAALRSNAINNESSDVSYSVFDNEISDDISYSQIDSTESFITEEDGDEVFFCGSI